MSVKPLITASMGTEQKEPLPIDSRPNSVLKLQERVREGRLSWLGPLVMCFVRFPILLLCFLSAFGVLQLTGQQHAMTTALNLTRYNLPLVADLLCLLLLARLVRKEGIHLRDLFCATRQHILRDLVLGIALFMGSYIAVAGLNVLSLFVFYGPNFFQNTQALQTLLGSTGINPLGIPFQIAISLLVLPISVGFVEELVYRGYAQPRIQALSGSKWLAILLMALGFGLQHVVFGLLSWQFALSGFLTTFVTGIIFGGLYLLNKQRLSILILIHWQSDLISLGLLPLLMAHFIK
ncbi:CPBP family intramembrane glutamic endopeptidase [Dictyobacter kobayashii]|uniref:CAAX prenyl protease 2/Lysostaphin resistance protein A-like domain-containing protein n=1 Tax=Dictyobacter kobayashii TaxID=2014872 RepID=A0A402AYS8_9CHLR|nr:CPBP family intramembrane glutamic endopeptidase [Dictyobacter kobayashii]GCE24227.1 hypothetical protein KDK_80270 [Dictyobacter kobayashii]